MKESGSSAPVEKLSIRSNKYRYKNISYFDPGVEGEGDITNVGKHVVYKHVYEFKERIEIYVT